MTSVFGAVKSRATCGLALVSRASSPPRFSRGWGSAGAGGRRLARGSRRGPARSLPGRGARGAGRAPWPAGRGGPAPSPRPRAGGGAPGRAGERAPAPPPPPPPRGARAAWARASGLAARALALARRFEALAGGGAAPGLAGWRALAEERSRAGAQGFRGRGFLRRPFAPGGRAGQSAREPPPRRQPLRKSRARFGARSRAAPAPAGESSLAASGASAPLAAAARARRGGLRQPRAEPAPQLGEASKSALRAPGLPRELATRAPLARRARAAASRAAPRAKLLRSSGKSRKPAETSASPSRAPRRRREKPSAPPPAAWQLGARGAAPSEGKRARGGSSERRAAHFGALRGDEGALGLGGSRQAGAAQSGSLSRSGLASARGRQSPALSTRGKRGERWLGAVTAARAPSASG